MFLSASAGRRNGVPTRKAGAKLLHFPDIRKKKRNYFQTLSNLPPTAKCLLSPLRYESIPMGRARQSQRYNVQIWFNKKIGPTSESGPNSL